MKNRNKWLKVIMDMSYVITKRGSIDLNLCEDIFAEIRDEELDLSELYELVRNANVKSFIARTLDDTTLLMARALIDRLNSGETLDAEDGSDDCLRSGLFCFLSDVLQESGREDLLMP